MNHPFLDKIWKTGLYLLFWLIFGYLYFYYVSAVNHLPYHFVVFESILVAFFQFSLNIGLWYFLKYNLIEEKNNQNLVANIALVGLIFDFLWIFGIYALIILFLGKNMAYSNFFWLSIWNKALLGIIIYSFMLLFYYLILYYDKFKVNLSRKNQLSLKLQEQELANLKAQINPHFLFNSLNSISNLVYENAENAHEAIVKLSDYFRFSLSTSKKQFGSLKEELENTQRYLDIEKIRFADKMQVVFRIAENVENNLVPLLILQPLVENAIKHGVSESLELVTISIRIQIFSAYIKISISNNFDRDSKAKKGLGLGLLNVKQRLELLYNRDDLLIIKEKDNFFEVEIFIPKSDHNE